MTEPTGGPRSESPAEPGPAPAAQPAAPAEAGPSTGPGAAAARGLTVAWPPLTYLVGGTPGVVGTLTVVAAASKVTHVLILVLIAFVLAVGLDPAVRWLGRFGVRRGWAVAIIFFGLVSFLALFVALMIPPLVREVQQF